MLRFEQAQKKCDGKSLETLLSGQILFVFSSKKVTQSDRPIPKIGHFPDPRNRHFSMAIGSEIGTPEVVQV